MTITVDEHVTIAMSDGCRLAATLFLPANARAQPVPAVLEYIPYRRRDGTRARDLPMHGFYAKNGIAGVRVDMRGSGDSEGLLADEYLAFEQDDALEVIAWIAAQPWCTGAVGMQGKSWGGFNALQVAARRPPALKAIITVCSTDNRYTDDIHFMGGCLLNDNLWWGSIMLAYQGRPPDPATAGPEWRARWLERLENMPFFPALWLAHQRYDAYWKHGSVCEDYASIGCPVLAIGGWADSYTNAIPRLLERLTVPRLGIIGPWGHVYPQDGTPGPAIGFLQEAVRWWNHWLRGLDRGIMREPMLRAYLEDHQAPTGTRSFAPGRWVGEPLLPSANVVFRSLYLREGGELGDAGGLHPGGSDATLRIRSPQSHGKAAGEWMGAGCAGENPTDQRLDDGGALLFETAPLDADVAVLGAPRLHLEVASDSPAAQLVARLCDVAPDGSVARVSYQVLNLTHRTSHEAPAPLEPGVRYAVDMVLNACGHVFAAGHRIRLAIGTAYWPMVWPAPHAATLTIGLGAGVLELPVRSSDDATVAFAPPVHGPRVPITKVDDGAIARFSMQDHVTGDTVYVTEGKGGIFGEGVLRLDDVGVQLSHDLRRELRIRDDDPLSARAIVTQAYEMVQGDRRVLVRTRAEMYCDAADFHMSGDLTVHEDEEQVVQRRWDETIPRDFM